MGLTIGAGTVQHTDNNLSFRLQFKQLAAISYESRMKISAPCLLISTVASADQGLLNQVNYQPVKERNDERIRRHG